MTLTLKIFLTFEDEWNLLSECVFLIYFKKYHKFGIVKRANKSAT